jgi:Family of unknown function (DUF6311)
MDPRAGATGPHEHLLVTRRQGHLLYRLGAFSPGPASALAFDVYKLDQLSSRRFDCIYGSESAARLLLKPFSPLLPHPFQYLGLEAVLLCSLQFFFGFRIFMLLLRGDWLASVLSAAFVLIAPPLTMRLGDHFTLANQWIVLAAVYLFLLILSDKTRRGRLLWFVALLTAVAVATNMYFAFSAVIILCAAAFGVWLLGRDEWRFALAIPAACCGAGLLSGVAFGLLRFDGAGAQGYREHAANLLTFFNPLGYGSLILRAIPTGGNSPEGFMYLGLGVLLLAVLLVATAFFKPPAVRSGAKVLVPAAICCTFLLLLSLSTRITLGSLVFDLDPRQYLTKYLSVFRASGRLAWTPHLFYCDRSPNRRRAGMASLAGPCTTFHGLTPADRGHRWSANRNA